MEKTKVLLGDQARQKMVIGLNKVADAVCSTLGPKGKTVVIDKGSFANVTKDGVTVARAIKLDDPEEALGARLLKEACSKTNDKVGDGTTSAALIARSLVQQGMKQLSGGFSASDIIYDMNTSLKEVHEKLDAMSKKVTTQEEIEQIASISANDAKIGKTIANMIKEIGNDGVILVEESQQNMEIQTEVTKGMRFNRGYKANWMITNSDKLESEFKDPFVLVTDKKIVSQHDIVPIMQLCAANGKNEMVLICEDVEGEALASIMINGGNGVFRMLVVKAPEFGERKAQTLEDIALLTGGKFINTETGAMQLKDVQKSDLGRASKVVSSRDYTVIAGGKGDDKKIADRVKEIKKEIENTESDYEKGKIRIRLGNLTGGVGVIKVGAPTESELKEIKDRVEDAVAATKAATDGGILPGGGTALLAINMGLENHSILKQALLEPIKQIARNADKEPTEVLMKVKEGIKSENPHYGYDAKENKYETDMMEAGIVDPTKVVKMALDTAVSVATSILNSECLVTNIPEKKE